MAVLLALISGIGSLFNLYLLDGQLLLQGLLTLLAWVALFTFRGKNQGGLMSMMVLEFSLSVLR